MAEGRGSQLRPQPQSWINYQDYLRSNWKFLQSNLVLDPKLLGIFYAETFLSLGEYERLTSTSAGTSRDEKVSEFLLIINRKGPDCLDTLLTGLDETQPHLSKQLKAALPAAKEGLKSGVRRQSTMKLKLKMTAAQELTTGSELQAGHRIPEALQHHGSALALFDAVGDPVGKIECLCRLGVDHFMSDRTDLCEARLAEAVELSNNKDIASNEKVKITLALAKASHEIKKFGDADKYLTICLNLSIEEYNTEIHPEIAEVHLSLAKNYLEQEFPFQSFECAQKSLKCADESFVESFDISVIKANTHQFLGEYHERAQDYISAEEAYALAYALYSSSSSKNPENALRAQKCQNCALHIEQLLTTESSTSGLSSRNQRCELRQSHGDSGIYGHLWEARSSSVPDESTTHETVGPMETGHDLEISQESLDFLVKLETGNYGEVWKGMWKKTINVVIRKLEPGSMSPQAVQEQVLLLKSCNHDKLVQFHTVCSTAESTLFITEHMPNGILRQYLRDENNAQGLSLNQLVDFVTQVALGMCYLEDNKYIHKNLMSRRIYIGCEKNIKIDLFGVSLPIPGKDYCYTGEGVKIPVKWTAPEVLLDKRFTTKSDVWSFGILMVEILTFGKIPYPGISSVEYKNIVQKGYLHPKPQDCPDELYEVMTDCWCEDPTERPTFRYLVKRLEQFSRGSGEF